MNDIATSTQSPAAQPGSQEHLEKTRQIKRILSALGAITLMVMTGCGHEEAKINQPAASVTVAPVQQEEVVEWSSFTGRTEPVESVEVRPRVSGYIDQVHFQSGQLVKKGDILFTIDPRWNKAILDQRQAEYKQAKNEAARSVRLRATKAISAEEAEARVAREDEAKAALDTATLDFEYCQVRAPIDGKVSRALLTEGNYVTGGSSLLTTLVSVNPIYVYADVDEDELLKFNELMAAKKLGNGAESKVAVELELAGEQGFPHKGYIESFDNRLDANTGTILLRALFANDDSRILPGLFARIRIPLSERHPVLLVEERAIGTDQAQKFVLALTSSNTVQYQPVVLGPQINGKRVVRSGLIKDQKIVVNGLSRVRPGMPVSPHREGELADGGIPPTANR